MFSGVAATADADAVVRSTPFECNYINYVQLL